MTIGVGATFPGGVVIGADSRIVIGREAAAQFDDSGVKAFEIQRKGLAGVVAGDLQVNLELNNEEAKGGEPPVLDAFTLIRGALEINRGPHDKLINDCMTIYRNVSEIINHSMFDCQVLIGSVTKKGRPRLWIRLLSCVDGRLIENRELDALLSTAGVGVYQHYRKYEAFPDKVPDNKQALIASAGAPPIAPDHQFDTREAAIDWVTAVVTWCCVVFPEICGGDPKICVIDTTSGD